VARRKRYSSQFKAQVVLELLKEEKTVGELSSEHGIHQSLLTRWKAEALEKLLEVFEKTGS